MNNNQINCHESGDKLIRCNYPPPIKIKYGDLNHLCDCDQFPVRESPQRMDSPKRKSRCCKSRKKKRVYMKSSPVYSMSYQDMKPPPPPEGREDLWDLQYCRWWGWNWVKRKDEEIQKRMKTDYKEGSVTMPNRVTDFRTNVCMCNQKERKNCFKDFCKNLSCCKSPSYEYFDCPNGMYLYNTKDNPTKFNNSAGTLNIDLNKPYQTYEQKPRRQYTCNKKCQAQFKSPSTRTNISSSDEIAREPLDSKKYNVGQQRSDQKSDSDLCCVHCCHCCCCCGDNGNKKEKGAREKNTKSIKCKNKDTQCSYFGCHKAINTANSSNTKKHTCKSMRMVCCHCCCKCTIKSAIDAKSKISSISNDTILDNKTDACIETQSITPGTPNKNDTIQKLINNLDNPTTYYLHTQRNKEKMYPNYQKHNLSSKNNDTKKLPKFGITFEKFPWLNKTNSLLDNNFSSPLSGQTYDLSFPKINAVHANTSSLPKPIDPTTNYNYLKSVISPLEDKNSYNKILLEAVCEAILERKSPRSVDPEESILLNEFTYSDSLPRHNLENNYGFSNKNINRNQYHSFQYPKINQAHQFDVNQNDPSNMLLNSNKMGTKLFKDLKEPYTKSEIIYNFTGMNNPTHIANNMQNILRNGTGKSKTANLTPFQNLGQYSTQYKENYRYLDNNLNVRKFMPNTNHQNNANTFDVKLMTPFLTNYPSHNFPSNTENAIYKNCDVQANLLRQMPCSWDRYNFRSIRPIKRTSSNNSVNLNVKRLKTPCTTQKTQDSQTASLISNNENITVDSIFKKIDEIVNKSKVSNKKVQDVLRRAPITTYNFNLDKNNASFNHKTDKVEACYSSNHLELTRHESNVFSTNRHEDLILKRWDENSPNLVHITPQSLENNNGIHLEKNDNMSVNVSPTESSVSEKKCMFESKSNCSQGIVQPLRPTGAVTRKPSLIPRRTDGDKNRRSR